MIDTHGTHLTTVNSRTSKAGRVLTRHFLNAAVLFIVICTITCAASYLCADPWPQFRGANASGVSRETAELPADIGPEKHVQWKTPLARGHSSPVVYGKRVYLTALRDRRLVTMALDTESGHVAWETEAPYEKLESVHKIGSPATSSVATDGRHVYSFFGSSGLFCYDLDGKEIWQRKLGPFNNQFGATSSPILAGDKLVMIQDHDTGSHLAAFDKLTGKTILENRAPQLSPQLRPRRLFGASTGDRRSWSPDRLM